MSITDTVIIHFRDDESSLAGCWISLTRAR
jgi:hypothetical protein